MYHLQGKEYDHKLTMGIIRLYFQYTTKQIYLTLLALLGSVYRLKRLPCPFKRYAYVSYLSKYR